MCVMPNGQEEFSLQMFNDQEENISLPNPASFGPSVHHDDAGAYGILKCYFYTPKRGDIWGAFCFLFNGATGESMENVFWVTRTLTG